MFRLGAARTWKGSSQCPVNQRFKERGMFTESKVANERICCSLQGNREHKEDILNSFGREKREAITILKLEGAARRCLCAYGEVA